MVGVHGVGDQIWCQSLSLLGGVRCCLLIGIRYHSVALILLHEEGVRWIGFVTRVLNCRMKKGSLLWLTIN